MKGLRMRPAVAGPADAGILQKNANNLRSERGMRFRITHAMDVKALLRSVSASSLSFAGFSDSGLMVQGLIPQPR